MARAKRVGVLTGGGDVPGLNPAIKAVVERATGEGHEVIGIRRGWGGLLNANPDDADTWNDHMLDLTPATVRTVDRTGDDFPVSLVVNSQFPRLCLFLISTICGSFTTKRLT